MKLFKKKDDKTDSKTKNKTNHKVLEKNDNSQSDLKTTDKTTSTTTASMSTTAVQKHQSLQDALDNDLSNILSNFSSQSAVDKLLISRLKKNKTNVIGAVPKLKFLAEYLHFCPKQKSGYGNSYGGHGGSSYYGYNYGNQSVKYDGPSVDVIVLFINQQTATSLSTGTAEIAKVLNLFKIPKNHIKFSEITKPLHDAGYKFTKDNFEALAQSLMSGLSSLYNVNKGSQLITNYINGVKFYLTVGVDPEPLFDYLLLSKEVHNDNLYNSNYRYSNSKDVLLKIIKDSGLTKGNKYKPAQKYLDDAYSKGYYLSIEILQTIFGLTPTFDQIKKLLTSGNGLSSGLKDSIRQFLTKLYAPGYKLSKDEFELVFLFEKRNGSIDNYLKNLMTNNVLDLNIHSQMINDNFGSIERANTIQKLVEYGLVLEQKIVEKVCNQRNLPLLKSFVDQYGLKVNAKCLENACKLKNNGATISYLLEKDVTPNSQSIVNYADTINNSTLHTLIKKYVKATGGGNEVQAIYSDSESE